MLETVSSVFAMTMIVKKDRNEKEKWKQRFVRAFLRHSQPTAVSVPFIDGCSAHNMAAIAQQGKKVKKVSSRASGVRFRLAMRLHVQRRLQVPCGEGELGRRRRIGLFYSSGCLPDSIGDLCKIGDILLTCAGPLRRDVAYV